MSSWAVGVSSSDGRSNETAEIEGIFTFTPVALGASVPSKDEPKLAPAPP